MPNRARFILVAAAVMLAGCYHVTVETGLPVGATGVHKEWASSFIYGLVPPATIESAKICTQGVAKVETQQSFLNGLVAVLTVGIYTPWQVDVTCASSNKMGAIPAGAAMVTLRAGATAEEVKAAFLEAASRSAKEGVPVYVTF